MQGRLPQISYAVLPRHDIDFFVDTVSCVLVMMNSSIFQDVLDHVAITKRAKQKKKKKTTQRDTDANVV